MPVCVGRRITNRPAAHLHASSSSPQTSIDQHASVQQGTHIMLTEQPGHTPQPCPQGPAKLAACGLHRLTHANPVATRLTTQRRSPNDQPVSPFTKASATIDVPAMPLTCRASAVPSDQHSTAACLSLSVPPLAQATHLSTRPEKHLTLSSHRR